MAPKIVKTAPPRPTSVREEEERWCCPDCARQQKIDTALDMVDMFLGATRPVLMPHPNSGDPLSYCPDLKPKEEAAYMAALDWLERYLDGPEQATPGASA